MKSIFLSIPFFFLHGHILLCHCKAAYEHSSAWHWFFFFLFRNSTTVYLFRRKCTYIELCGFSHISQRNINFLLTAVQQPLCSAPHPDFTLSSFTSLYLSSVEVAFIKQNQKHLFLSALCSFWSIFFSLLQIKFRLIVIIVIIIIFHLTEVLCFDFFCVTVSEPQHGGIYFRLPFIKV